MSHNTYPRSTTVAGGVATAIVTFSLLASGSGLPPPSQWTASRVALAAQSHPHVTASIKANERYVSTLFPLNERLESFLNSGDMRGDEALLQIKRISGLTWDNIAYCMGVDRRTIHNWARGLKMAQSNQIRLMRVLSALLDIDRGLAIANQEALLTPISNGNLPIDLLRQEEFSAFTELIGTRGNGNLRAAVKNDYSPYLSIAEALEISTDAPIRSSSKLVRGRTIKKHDI